jgi:hypothetical protein
LVVWKLGSELEENIITYDNNGVEIVEKGIKKVTGPDNYLTSLAE